MILLSLKRTLLFMVLWVPFFALGQDLLIAKTHLTVTECTLIVGLVTMLPANLVVQFWLAPRLGLQYRSRPKRILD